MANYSLSHLLRAGVFAAFTCGSLSCWAADAFEEYVSLNLGTSFSSTLDTKPSTLNTTLDLNSGQSLSLGYGLQENHWRVLLELNQTSADIQVSGANTNGNLTATTLFYNVYWVPEFDYNISAIIGAGLGYGETTIKDIHPLANGDNKISNDSWAAKLALGVEYRVQKEISVQLIYQNWITDKVEDDKVTSWSVDNIDHGELSLGAAYRF